MPPGHHLVAVSVGECAMNESVSGSKVAVVSNPLTKVPCPSSVCAYVPMTFRSMDLGNHSACCSGDPCESRLGTNICTDLSSASDLST